MTSRLRVLASRLWATVRRRRRDREFTEELATHLSLLVEEELAAGLTPADARHAALGRLGRLDLLAELHRDVRGVPLVDVLAHDLRAAARRLRRAPGFTLVVVLSLALGIGANTALFSLVDDVLLRSLPVTAPERLVHVQQGVAFIGLNKPVPFFPADVFDAVRARRDIVSEAVGFMRLDRPPITVDGIPEPSREVDRVSPGFFRDLGVRLALGRAPEPGDGQVVVISHRLWRERFDGARGVLGRRLSIEGQDSAIVGVAPADFTGMQLDSATDLWIARPTPGPMQMIVRLQPDVTFERAAAALDAVLPQPEGVPVRATAQLQPAGKGLSALREQYENALWALTVLVLVLLLITCTNVGSLLMVRGLTRRRELTVRAALGAPRWRLVSASLIESAILAAVGGAAALVVAAGGVSLVLSMLPLPVAPANLVFAIDTHVLAFTAAMSVACAVLIGLAPALRATSVDPTPALGSSTGRTITPSSRRLGRGLVASQIGLSVILLVGAGLFVRTLGNLATLDVGFAPDRLVQVLIDTRRAGYARGQVGEVYRRLLESVAAVPGVESVTGARNPLMRGAHSRGFVRLPGLELTPDDAWDSADVGPAFFETMGMPLLRGRTLAASDFGDRRAPALVVNDAWVRRFFPNDDPVARGIGIVGVVADARLAGVRAPAGPMMFMPTAPEPDRINALEVRTTGDPAGVIPAIGDAVRQINPRLLTGAQTMRAEMERDIARERLVAAISGAFGLLALLLVAIGIFGVASSTVTERTSELGIRMALGASRGAVVAEALRDTARLFAAGLAVGLIAAIAGVRLVRSLVADLLFGIQATDTTNISLAVAVIVMVAAAACVLPARRATRIDPIAAIGRE